MAASWVFAWLWLIREKSKAMIVQNAASHKEGLSPLWAIRLAFWHDRAAYEAEVRGNLLSLKATQDRPVGLPPYPEQINPDTWVDEY